MDCSTNRSVCVCVCVCVEATEGDVVPVHDINYRNPDYFLQLDESLLFPCRILPNRPRRILSATNHAAAD